MMVSLELGKFMKYSVKSNKLFQGVFSLFFLERCFKFHQGLSWIYLRKSSSIKENLNFGVNWRLLGCSRLVPADHRAR